MANLKRTSLKKINKENKDPGLLSLKQSSIPSAAKKLPAFLSAKNIIIIVILLAAVLFWKFKGYFIVATVNGQPISRFELTGDLIKRFGSQSLDNIINERLILGATRQKGIFVTDDDISIRTKDIEKKLQGTTTLKDALLAQGLSESDFKKQLEIQIAIEKLFDKESTVSSSEIKDYISQNQSAYKSATDPAAVNKEVESILHQQKVRDQFDKWFSDIRKNANIQKYL